jgi:putative membrane protein
MFLTPDEAGSLDAHVARVEAHTGVQIVTAVVGKSDTYAELPWMAFALGASAAACLTVAADAWQPAWVTARTALVLALAVLGTGGAAALLAVFARPVARLFLRDTRSHTEVRQYAESLFLRREVFRTADRTGILLLVSLFERRIEIVPDTGLAGRVSDADWQAVVARMGDSLRRRRPADALQEGLSAIEALLQHKGFRAGHAGPNELPDRPVEERGV